MKQRIITALILAPLVILGVFMLPLSGFMLMLGFITLLGLWEWTQFVEMGTRAQKMVLLFASFLIPFLFIPESALKLSELTGALLVVVVGGAIWWLIASVLAITHPKYTASWKDSHLLRFVFGVLTLVPFFWSIAALRAIDIDTDFYYGAKLVMYVCALVWAADSGAYFAGRKFGKHKMAPSVSPNKTIEGLIGGIIVAMLIGWGLTIWFGLEFSTPWLMMLLTLVTVVISVLGDLVESMFKRVAGIKDSSNIIPGHGGVLDRIDSLTAAFPVFTVLYFMLQ
ncbi:phosphatidate cytidylyltransferase [Vibrio breoganii]|uniref:phosphatidate cytidylyltransferase n=1 Tax=Vibrio breoganii TaxID=553239 RepID=UPI000C868432|nr:phosphatidate cytidylyltransferase [Vibrio breoganii]PMK20489.1 CDP-diglyceride synthetase [Vibrio breoganii]PMK35952.1 CDP-diglyceride synthetase [Vibrio breoganii]PMM52225.1 CDP-diglyceride synthetase [Vibrio breoganii]